MSFSIKLFLLLLGALVATCYATDQQPEVRTPLGRIKGSLMRTRLNKTIYAFRAVRYGKSPEGERRFKQAEPVDSWTDTFDATKEGPTCPRYDDSETSSEDCLRLNVYATKLPDSKNKVNRPVIVYFHPGGFYGFSGQSSVFGPQYYLDKDIVLVVVNYRLGTLGFIASGDANAPGNLGLKDQVVALRWIKQNIASFGGDPNSITITGCSAGAWSVIFHMMSPMSKGLFHRVIAMSGGPTVPDLLPNEQKDLVIKQASFVNCPTDSVEKAFKCLKTVPFQNITASQPKFAEWYGDPVLIWSPVVEPDIPGVERFLTAQPVDLLRLKQFQHVPVVIGTTKNEFDSLPMIALEQALNGDDTIYRNLTQNWDFAAPISFQYQRGTQRSKNISAQLKKFYFNDKPITAENGRNLGVIYSDSQIDFPTHRTAQLLGQYSSAPVYRYQFTYQGRFSFAVWSDTKKPYGVVHQDDLQYIFYMSFGFPFFNATDPEVKMVEKLTTLWETFANTGNPIPKNNNDFKGVTWTPLNPKEQNYLDINEELRMKNKVYPERMELWERLFPLLPIPSTRQ